MRGSGAGVDGAFLGSGQPDVALALTKSGGFEERLRKRTRTHACVAHDLEEAMPHTKIGGGKLRRGEVKELLHGVPIEVKDLCWTSNRRHGIYKDYMPPEDYKDYMPSEDGRGPKIRCAVILAGLQTTDGAYADRHPDITAPRHPWDATAWGGASWRESSVPIAAGP